jgi:deoxyribose-phosphate aldolase
MNLNKYIDHTLLKNTALKSEYDQLIKEAKLHEFFSVCVPPSWVSYCLNNGVTVCSVAGFSQGYSLLRTKVTEIENLFDEGCDEVDVVLNISALKSGDWSIVSEELKAFHDISKSKTLKVIVESGMQTQDELLRLCDIFNDYPSTFIKTSTGFMEKGAVLEQVKFMRERLDKSILIKASGGIRDQKAALDFIEAGASRLGTSASVSIVTGENSESRSTY